MTIDLYQNMTDRIIKELEYGTVPWHKPWCTVNGGCFNRISGRHYSLLNNLRLQHSGEYATYEQWQSLGGRIRKGAKGEKILFWKEIEPDESKETDEVTETEQRRRFVLRYYTVFHISSVIGVEPLPQDDMHEHEHDRIQKAEELTWGYIGREGINLKEEPGNKAYYSPSEDRIQIPCLSQYEDVEEYYSTLMHEMIHSTGHEKRLNRPGLANASFGSEEYSKEELIAEIGAASILNGLGIESENSFNNSISYIDGWIKKLKEDKYLIINAASAAEKAARYILNAEIANA